jgi:hypothetical protein
VTKEGDRETLFFMKEMPRYSHDREVAALRALSKHADSLYIVNMADAFVLRDNGSEFWYLVVEFAPHGDLQSIADCPDLPEMRALLRGMAMALALAEVHARRHLFAELSPLQGRCD